jgi:hypothetical protein
MTGQNSSADRQSISWGNWNRTEISIRDAYERRSLELQKASVEFSKILVTNLTLINAGALVALPATATFMGVSTAATLAEEVNFVGIPAILYTGGLFCGLLCGYMTYRNYQYGQASVWPAYQREIAQLRKDLPWMKADAAYQTKVSSHLESSTVDLKAQNLRVQITYYTSLTLSDAGELILRLPDMLQTNPKWTYATELLMQAARSGKKDQIADACAQLLRAAMTDGYAARR